MRVSFIIKCISSLCFCNHAEIITMLTNTYFSVECIIIIIIMSDNFMMPRGIKPWQCCCGPSERLKSSVGTRFAGKDKVIQDFLLFSNITATLSVCLSICLSSDIVVSLWVETLFSSSIIPSTRLSDYSLRVHSEQ